MLSLQYHLSNMLHGLKYSPIPSTCAHRVCLYNALLKEIEFLKFGEKQEREGE